MSVTELEMDTEVNKCFNENNPMLVENILLYGNKFWISQKVKPSARALASIILIMHGIPHSVILV